MRFFKKDFQRKISKIFLKIDMVQEEFFFSSLLLNVKDKN